jgi:hypothetical protein
MAIFGGSNGVGDLADSYVLTYANGLGGTPTWIQGNPSDPLLLPPPRNSHTATVELSSQRMTIFGGFGSSLNDVWMLTDPFATGDDNPPVIAAVQATPSSLFPADRRMVAVSLSVQVTDDQVKLAT